MRNLTVTKRIKVNFTAEQWDLYTHERDCTNAVRDLNFTLERYFNEGLPKSEVYDKVYEAMKRNSAYGACDSEPIYFLDRVLKELYFNPADLYQDVFP